MKRVLAISMSVGLWFGSIATIASGGEAREASDLASQFLTPPDSARPWVYWFWLNGNITKEGITADLEAMQRVGIDGALIMEVDQGSPVGSAPFLGPKWRELFQHAVAEAGRLGLKINMNNDAGWNGSGGPWIKPEQSMQTVVWSEAAVAGPKHVDAVLVQPKTVAGYYRDIAVLAFPSVGDYRIDNIAMKAGYQPGPICSPSNPTDPTAFKEPPGTMVIDRDRIVDLSAKMDANGRLIWDAPPGKWTVVRFGHTSTGAENAPAPASGRGLECDKLSKEGVEANFNGMMARLIADVGPAAGKALAATHVDSWENGTQNWTKRMPEEFKTRRGYPLAPWLPVLTGRVVGSLEVSERFLWDFRRTISAMVIENYAGRLRDLAHQHGLKFTIEAYGSPCDHLFYAGQCDEPMGEFWVGGWAVETCREMASAGHIYGRSVIGAEAFTAADQERWREHPATIKALGDQAFCEGINRFVFHRYALQPWLDRRPGMTMGPWGVHYERTQTWWELTPAWHQYLARCQHLLRQGLYVADLCYLEAEDSPQGPHDRPRQGYAWDQCNAEVVLGRMRVGDGRLVLPDGMSYRLLVLPPSSVMTPALLGKIKELVEAGATVVGPRPVRSPSLGDYPQCDAKIRQLAAELWGDCDGKTMTEHHCGKGKIICGKTPEAVLADMGVTPDFHADVPIDTIGLRYIHRAVGGTDVYFIANGSPCTIDVPCTFRVKGKRPEFWRPDAGRIEPVAIYEETDAGTRIPIVFEPSGSLFVVFRSDAKPSPDRVTALSRDGKSVLGALAPAEIVVKKGIYGVPGDPARTRDVTAWVQETVKQGKYSFRVASAAQSGDPAFGVVKKLTVEYTIGGNSESASAADPELIFLRGSSQPRDAEIRYDAGGRPLVEARKPGRYEVKMASGKMWQFDVAAMPSPLDVAGPWELRFPPGNGAPEHVTLDKLISWTAHADAGVKYFSGAAIYAKTFQTPVAMIGADRRICLDLGKVQVIAQVKLNGKNLGVLWKPPFRIDVTGAVKAGDNALEIQVVNLWPNRLIGDEQLPEDSDRNPDGTLKSWPKWLEEGKPSPTGRSTFTTWRLWKKGDPLLESGLLGPVRLLTTETVLCP